MVASTNAMKLLVAGCLVGLLSGVSVRADGLVPGEEMADGAAETPMDQGPMDQEQMDDPAGGDPEDPAGGDPEDPAGGDPEDPAGGENGEPEDGEPGEPEDGENGEQDEEVPLTGGGELAAPVEPGTEQPAVPLDDATTPAAALEEPDDAMAPEADGKTSPDPDPEVLKTLGYDIVQGVDYLDAPDVDMLLVDNAEECAEECDADTSCNLAAYYVAEFPGGFNCWLKTLDPGCTVPTDTEPAPNAWLMVSDNKCDIALAPGAAPVAAANGTYERYPGMDYIPADAVPGAAAKNITVMDVGTGSLVDTIEECEAECDATATCNAAAFLGTAQEDTGFNCYLKNLDIEDCQIPTDADDVPDATLSIKCASAVAPTSVAAAPPGVANATAASPTGAEFASPPTSDDVGSDDVATRAPAGDTEAGDGVATDASSVAALATSVAAVAVAGAIALL